MAPRKLSDADKQDILILYRQPEETTSTLASRYGVSNTTISRILKQSLPSEEYDLLVQQKRTGAVRSDPEPKAQPAATEVQPAETANVAEPSDNPAPKSSTSSRRKRKRLSNAAEEPDSAEQLEITPPPAEEPAVAAKSEDATPVVTQHQAPVLKKQSLSSQGNIVSLNSHVEDDDDGDDLDDDDLDDDDDFDDDGGDDEDDDGDNEGFAAFHIRGEDLIQVLPLADAPIPRTCYLVVDRASELITRPLKDFAELGKIPSEETQARTLPIFDNHRVARRFSKRLQRVVKVPDGKLLQKASPYLQAKGITRLLIDGHVYSLN